MLMRMLAAGRYGLLVECDGLERVSALYRMLAPCPPEGVTELVPASQTLLLIFDSSTTHRKLAACLAGLTTHGLSESGVAGEEEISLTVVYDGEDLAEVADLIGWSVEEVVRRHQAETYLVGFVGFSPGFAYLSGGDPRLLVPRRSSPRVRVRRGSVGLAGGYTGVYPRDGPGGWQIIGRTDAILWDLDREPPALLVPGMRVRFHGASS